MNPIKPTKGIIAQGESTVNQSGVASISRKYKGMKVVWIIPKNQNTDECKQAMMKEGN